MHPGRCLRLLNTGQALQGCGKNVIPGTTRCGDHTQLTTLEAHYYDLIRQLGVCPRSHCAALEAESDIVWAEILKAKGR